MPVAYGIQDTGKGSLELLAMAFDRAAYAVTLVEGKDHRPHLAITNRAHKALTENIYAAEGWFWWGWAERIAPVTEITQAAGVIMRVLRHISGGTG